MVKQIYSCDISNYSIEYEIVGEYAELGPVNSDFKNILAFVTLLRNSVHNLMELKVTKITLVTVREDIPHLHDTTWLPYRGTRDPVDLIYLVCDIGDFLSNMGKSLGIPNID
jgi:hypothetical protein